MFMVKKMEQSDGAVEGVSIPVLASSVASRPDDFQRRGCTQAAFSAYCHHVQVAPVSVLSALQKLAGIERDADLAARVARVRAMRGVWS